MPETEVVTTASFIYTIFRITSFENEQKIIEIIFLNRMTAAFIYLKTLESRSAKIKSSYPALRIFSSSKILTRAAG